MSPTLSFGKSGSGRPADLLLPDRVAGGVDLDDLAGDVEVLDLRTRLAADRARLVERPAQKDFRTLVPLRRPRLWPRDRRGIGRQDARGHELADLGAEISRCHYD